MPHARTYRPRWLAVALAAAAAVPVVSPAPAVSADAPPSARPAEGAADMAKRVADAVDALASDDFAVREAAAKVLWQIGDPAVPALKEAARSGNPEVAKRARNILGSFAFGVRPDTPKPVVEQLNAYRQGGAEQKRAAVAELTRLDAAGARVLLRLAADERDPELKKLVTNGLMQSARPAAAAMINQGDNESAAALLAFLAPRAEFAARDQAALLLLTGGLDDALAALQTPPDPAAVTPADRRRLAALLRAKGDAARAAEAASAVGEAVRAEAARLEADAKRLEGNALRGQVEGEPQDIVRFRALAEVLRAEAITDDATAAALMAEAGQYAELARRTEARIAALAGVEPSIEDLGYAAAYHRLAGNQAAADRWVKRIVDRERADPNDHRNAAEALLLNERPAEAVRLLVEAKDPVTALEFAPARFDFALGDQLLAEARKDKSLDLPRVLAKTAPLLQHQGREVEAANRLESVVRGESGPVTTDVWLDAIEAAPLAGIPAEKIDGWVARAVTVAANRPGESADRLFWRARLLDPAKAQTWWRVLRDHRWNTPPAEAMALVRRLDRKQVTGDELDALLLKTRELAGRLQPAERVARLALVADVLADADRVDEAVDLYEKEVLPQAKTAATLLRVGDLYAKAGRWDKAAGRYAAARALDPSDARPVALQGWALAKQGKAGEGERLIALAHVMPLGDETARGGLAEALAKAGLKDEARRERELVGRTGDVRSWAYADAVRRLAGEVSRTDPLAAAAIWDRVFLSNLSPQTSFVDPTANLTIPVLIRRSKAVGHARAGQVGAALEDARVAFEAYPADADTQVAIVRELEKAKRQPEADAVYRRAFDRYEGLLKQYPASAQANNLVAWLAACAKRDLDHALACARKGVELAPGNTAILDTLSEVYHARGEHDAALAVNAQCRALEPWAEHHKRNLTRFTAAKAGKPVEGGEAPGDEE